MAEAKTLDEILEGRFIQRSLQEYAKDVNAAQVKYMDAHHFSNDGWRSGRKFEVNDNNLLYSQMLKHRFVDMKFISAGMEKHKKKVHPVYNKIIYGHYNNLIRELKYGFVDAVKEDLRKLEE
ncbi:hypothetical protein [Flavobacterium psychrotrophum]|uniref:hypothetical protein n=1 Tax=Flavobacterium psychrotrophum TaxID=2294119 RepID=UPI000E3242EC|nr:hypothetical protein [Flavobacterium psychrotrophum]